MKFVHYLLLAVYMSADSNTVGTPVGRFIITSKEIKTMQSKTLRLFTVVLGLSFMMAAASQLSRAQEHKAINLSSARGLPFSDGIIAGNTLYVAGQEGTDDAGKLAAGGIGAETKAALDNIAKVLKAAGYEMKDVVSVTVYWPTFTIFQK
jgi:enamine deaminase RidA (YjgF/YER057c/UK114 family)